MRRAAFRWFGGLLGCVGIVAVEAQEAPGRLPVSKPARSTPVDFHREIVPMLRANCLPCHNKTTTKADLLLETPAQMLKGGESGPVIVPGKPAESLMFRVSTHEAKPKMPPKENKVNARALTADELGLLELWIEQGAKAPEVVEEVIDWKGLPTGLVSIYAVGVSADGRLAACGRGGQVHVYDVPTGSLLEALVDPATPGSAHRDQVSSLAVSPDGERIATGGFREVKLWRRKRLPTAKLPSLGTNTIQTQRTFPVQSLDGVWTLSRTDAGMAMLDRAKPARSVAILEREGIARSKGDELRARLALAKSEVEARKALREAAEKELQAQRDRLRKAREAHGTAEQTLGTRQAALDSLRRVRNGLETAATLLRERRSPPVEEARLKEADGKVAEAGKALEKAEAETSTARLKESTTRNEVELAVAGVARADLDLSAARWELGRSQDRLGASESHLAAWDETRELLRSPMVAGGFSSDGRWVVTVHEDRTVRSWLTSTAEPFEVQGPEPTVPDVVEFVPGGGIRIRRTARTGGERVRVVSPASRWVLERTLGTGDSKSVFIDRVTALAFRPDGERLVTGGGDPSRSGELRVWDVATGEAMAAWPQLHSDVVLSAGYSPDGLFIASGGADRFVRMVEPATARVLRSFEGHTGHVLGVAWAPHGRFLVSGAADLTVKWWDVATGTRRKQAAGFTKEIGAVGYLEGGRVAAVSGDPGVRILNENGDTLAQLEAVTDFQNAAAATPDGRWIASGGRDGVLRVWRDGVLAPVAVLNPPERPGTGSARAGAGGGAKGMP